MTDIKEELLELKAELKNQKMLTEKLVELLIDEGVISRTDIENKEGS